MKHGRLPVLAGSALVLSALMSVAAMAQIGASDDLTTYVPAGEFSVTNGQMKGIAHSKTDQTYRICVGRASTDVPLKVRHDGKEPMVSPGDCADFEAMNIEVGPGAQLPRDYLLVGRFEHLK